MPPDSNSQPTIQPDQPRRVVAPARTPTTESPLHVLRAAGVPAPCICVRPLPRGDGACASCGRDLDVPTPAA